MGLFHLVYTQYSIIQSLPKWFLVRHELMDWSFLEIRSWHSTRTYFMPLDNIDDLVKYIFHNEEWKTLIVVESLKNYMTLTFVCHYDKDYCLFLSID